MGKKDKGGFKSLIEHIKQEIISSTGKPVEIREDTHLDKILSEEVEDINVAVEKAEKKLNKAKAKLNNDPSVKDAREKFKVAKANLDEAEQAYKKVEESGQGVEVALADKNNAAAEFEKAESIKIKTEKQVGDELKLTKLESDLKEAKTEREDTEKGLLWPPYYHYKDKLWSYFWFVKNPQNLSEVLKEKGKEIDHYEKECLVLIEKKGNDSPSGDNKVYFDKYPRIQTLWRFIKRIVRFFIWLFYVFVGSLFSGFKGNFKSFWLCLGILSIDIAGVLAFYQLLKLFFAWGKLLIGKIVECVIEPVIEHVIECVKYFFDWLIEFLNLIFICPEWSSILLWLGFVMLGVMLFLIFKRKNNKDNESKYNDKIAGNKDENYPLDDNQAEGEKENGKEIEAKVNESDDTTNKVNKTEGGQDCRWWQKVGTYIDKNDLDASRWRKPNAVVLFLCFILFIYFVISTVLFFVRDVVFFQPKMSITESGVVKMTQPCGVEQYLFVHSSAELWKDTGISVVKDDEIEVNYSGAFYSTIRDMDKSAVLRTPPRYRLMNSRQYGDGYGDDSIVRYCVYNDSDARLGQLLLQITPPGQEPKSQVGDSLIYAVDFSDGKYRNFFPAKKSGTLMVAVNDVFLKNDTINKKDAINTIREMLTNIEDEHLRCELLNHALYPMTSERLSSQSDALDSTITNTIKQTFVKDGAYSTLLDRLFIINKKIQYTHNLIRALVNSDDFDSVRNKYEEVITNIKNEDKDKKLTAKNIYGFIKVNDTITNKTGVSRLIEKTITGSLADKKLQKCLDSDTATQAKKYIYSKLKVFIEPKDSVNIEKYSNKILTARIMKIISASVENLASKHTCQKIKNYLLEIFEKGDTATQAKKYIYSKLKVFIKPKDSVNIEKYSEKVLASRMNKMVTDSVANYIKRMGIGTIVLQDGYVVGCESTNKHIIRDNLYAILFKYYIPQRDEILKQLDKFLKSSDQLNWEYDAKDFWYSDNTGDLLVSVRVSRNDIPWHMKIVRFIDRKIDRLGKDAQDIWYIFVVCVFILLLFLDCYFGAKKNMRLIKENLKTTEKCNNNNVHRFLTETSEKILPYYEERLSNDKLLVLLKIIAALIIFWIISLLMGPDYGVVTGMIVLLGIIICNWEVLFCKNYKNVIQKDIDFLKKLKK